LKSLSLILLFTPLALSEFKPKKDVLFITTLDIPTRLKRLCNIPGSVTWEEIHSKDKYRKLLAKKLKEYGLRVERKHK
jgi:hypothetical protein